MLPCRPADAGCFCLIAVLLFLVSTVQAEESVSVMPSNGVSSNVVSSHNVSSNDVSSVEQQHKGYAIFSELDRRNKGYVDMQVGLQMVLISKTGKKNHRSLYLKQLEEPLLGDQVLIRFDAPKDIKGTALLSKSNGDKPEDQWLYLPAFKRVKKIAMRNRSGPFVGSEFSFEDLSVQSLGDFNYQYLDTQMLNNEVCFVVARFPVDKYSAYSRQVVWIDQSEYRIQKIEYYNDDNERVKTLENGEYRLYQDFYWKPHYMSMVNHKNHRATELHWQDYDFAVGLSENRDFTTNSLRRWR